MLEDHYGVPLLDRGKNGVRPTVHGEVLIRDARRILAGFDGVEAHFRQVSNREVGKLRVGLSPVLCDLCRPQITTTLIRKHPGIEIELQCGTAEDLLSQLHHNKLDIMAAYERPMTLQQGVTVEHLYQDQPHWYVRTDHPAAAQTELGLDVLARFPLIMQPLPGAFGEWFDDIRLDTSAEDAKAPQIVRALHSLDYELLIQTLVETDCIGLIPDRNAKARERAGKLRALDLPHPPPPAAFALGWKADRTPSPLMNAFAETLSALSADGAG